MPSLDAATADFRKRVPPNGGVDDETAQRIANEIWSRKGWGDLPIRVLQTAKLLGFLSNTEAAIHPLTSPGGTGSRLDWPSLLKD